MFSRIAVYLPPPLSITLSIYSAVNRFQVKLGGFGWACDTGLSQGHEFLSSLSATAAHSKALPRLGVNLWEHK